MLEKENSSLYKNTQEYVCSITPEEFEVFCMKLFQEYAKKENLKDFNIEHNVIKAAYDGNYQIDVLAGFTAMGVRHRVLCECKQLSSKVKRERVEMLENRLNSLGYNKGILLSTRGFQSGAVQYANAHGVALIQVYDHSHVAVSHSGGPEEIGDDAFKYIEDHWPMYEAVLVTETPCKLYPTEETIRTIYEEAGKIMAEEYGIHGLSRQLESQ